MIQGVSGRERPGSGWLRIVRQGRESVFSDSGCVRAEETQVELVENRQDRPRINFPRFRVCQCGGDICGKKPKTEKQIRRWLASPYTDAAEYKLWGNGVSLPIVFFVLSGIAWAAGKEQA